MAGGLTLVSHHIAAFVRQFFCSAWIFCRFFLIGKKRGRNGCPLLGSYMNLGHHQVSPLFPIILPPLFAQNCNILPSPTIPPHTLPGHILDHLMNIILELLGLHLMYWKISLLRPSKYIILSESNMLTAHSQWPICFNTKILYLVHLCLPRLHPVC